jgi:CheY-like chemotaxis protein
VLLEEFYQLRNPERDRAQGLGLGLAIVRRLAGLLGHEVEVDSREDRGSVFRVLLPAGDPAGIGANSSHAPLPPGDLDGQRIVVVDDEIEIRDGMRALLAQWGCVAIVAASAREAIAHFAAGTNPDAVIVDYRLRDGEDGVDAVERLRTRFGSGLPAIVISGESSTTGIARIAASGLILLHKPVPPAKLRSALTFLLSRRALAAD